MISPRSIAVVVLLSAAIAVFVSTAKAEDDAAWLTSVQFAEPVQIGGLLLQPGSYLIQRNSNYGSRYILMIYSVDHNRWEGMVPGVPASRSAKSMQSGLTFLQHGSGTPKVLEYWFHRGSLSGIEFAPSRLSTVDMPQTAVNTTRLQPRS